MLKHIMEKQTALIMRDLKLESRFADIKDVLNKKYKLKEFFPITYFIRHPVKKEFYVKELYTSMICQVIYLRLMYVSKADLSDLSGVSERILQQINKYMDERIYTNCQKFYEKLSMRLERNGKEANVENLQYAVAWYIYDKLNNMILD